MAGAGIDARIGAFEAVLGAHNLLVMSFWRVRFCYVMYIEDGILAVGGGMAKIICLIFTVHNNPRLPIMRERGASIHQPRAINVSHSFLH